MNPIPLTPFMPRCPICGVLLNKRQKFCSTACRVKGHHLREAARIADEARDKIYNMLRDAIIK